MKRAVSVSLGSSSRDKAVEIDLLGERVSLERMGTDGDIERATELFTELDGKVDALGVGGIDLGFRVFDRQYRLHAPHKMVRNVTRTPVVDGAGLKNTLEYKVVGALVDELGPAYASGRALLTAAVDRFGMTRAFFESGYEVACGDLMFALGVPLALRSLGQLRWLARLLMPVVGRFPISMLYPTGEKQDEIVPKFENWYEWASVVAGDVHYIKRHMPDDLSGTVIVTNTTTPEDMDMFRARGVQHVLTTTPVYDGRSFGTNMLEAALTAVAGHGRPLTDAELDSMLAELDLKPSLHTL